jgi:cytochrome c
MNIGRVVPLIALGVLALGATAFAQTPTGDAAAGEKIFNQCKACHSVKAGENRVGPSLHGVIGRKAGAAEGFKYSDAMKTSGVIWTPENIDKYLADPKGFIPGNKMAFAGLKKPEDRQNVLAYLAQQK